MRLFLAFLSLIITGGLIYALSRPIGPLPALGPLLNPTTGWLANAGSGEVRESAEIKLGGLRAPVDVLFEDRQVPHIRAQNNHDLYYAQGYVTAYFRLWQMDMQTRAAGGRVSEVAGVKALNFDRGQRRKGMVYAAEKSLAAMEAEPRTKEMLDAYRDGINAWITTVDDGTLPIEYKLMGFRPEPWSNLRSALLLKYMADDLTGATDDIALTYLRDRLSPEEFDFLYPEKIKGSIPVMPAGTKWETPSMNIPPVPGIPDSLFAHFSAGSKTSSVTPQSGIRNPKSGIVEESESGVGSNSWAIAGKHTASGAPILCNDPHLGLNLPSLWFEVQLTAPGINSYGVSLPGAPGIVIGFNDSISWGLTNNYRDVKDYYNIHPADKDNYWFNGEKTAYINRIEKISVKGAADFIDTVRYTVHGPIQYEPAFPSPDTNGRLLAMTWMAHRGTNEILALYQLNRAQNYDAFVEGISHFECPAQNFVYADRSGNIAQWGQGRFINKWKGQGKFVMEGRDSATLWGASIPFNENPHALNPEQGYLVGANQNNTDSTYPYWYNGKFSEFRSWRINEVLTGLSGRKATIISTEEDVPDMDGMFDSTKRLGMMQMQTDEKSVLLRQLYYRLTPLLETSQSNYFEQLEGKETSSSFPFVLSPDSRKSSFLQIWSHFLHQLVWQHQQPELAKGLPPSGERTMQLMILDSNNSYLSGSGRYSGNLGWREELTMNSFELAKDSLRSIRGGAEWYNVKNTSLTHLAKLPAFSYTGLRTGGAGNTINAMKQNHGPSWRMIVQMGKDSIEAYGVYPGGQSGNPGSKHYSDFIDHWVKGDYFRLTFLPANTTKNPFKISWTLKPVS